MLKKRELNIDILKTCAMLMVVLIHTTANSLVESYQTSNFKFFIVMGAITSSAVPLFYMMSGSFLIKDKNIDFKKCFLKTLKLLIQTIIWTIIYCCLFKYILKWDISIFKYAIKSIFSSQIGHFWFIYPLIGLYILSPFISTMYSKLSEKEKIFFLIFIFALPVVLCTINIWVDFVQYPSCAIGFPELGLFVLGKYIYDNRKKLNCKKARILSFFGILLGVISIVLLAYYYGGVEGITSTKPYFDYNKIPNVLLTSSILVFFTSLGNIFEKIPEILKILLTFIGSNTLGIYFIHMVFIYTLPKIKILGVLFSANNGRIINMILGAFLYFIMSIISVYIINKIPVINKLVK